MAYKRKSYRSKRAPMRRRRTFKASFKKKSAGKKMMFSGQKSFKFKYTQVFDIDNVSTGGQYQIPFQIYLLN